MTLKMIIFQRLTKHLRFLGVFFSPISYSRAQGFLSKSFSVAFEVSWKGWDSGISGVIYVCGGSIRVWGCVFMCVLGGRIHVHGCSCVWVLMHT